MTLNRQYATDTAVLKVLADILRALDDGDLALLTPVSYTHLTLPTIYSV